MPVAVFHSAQTPDLRSLEFWNRGFEPNWEAWMHVLSSELSYIVFLTYRHFDGSIRHSRKLTKCPADGVLHRTNFMEQISSLQNDSSSARCASIAQSVQWLGYRLDNRGTGILFVARVSGFSYLYNAQIDSGAYTTYYTVAIVGWLPGGKEVGAWNWTLTSI